VTVAQLRAEGIRELGAVPRSSALYVLTNAKLHLFHARDLPDRDLDAYAVNLAVAWIGDGKTSHDTANDLGVSEPTLRKALASAGYERTETAGNRRGKLVRRAATVRGSI
jgi:hypothetical protein